jgi:hypothetical protein
MTRVVKGSFIRLASAKLLNLEKEWEAWQGWLLDAYYRASM